MINYEKLLVSCTHVLLAMNVSLITKVPTRLTTWVQRVAAMLEPHDVDVIDSSVAMYGFWGKGLLAVARKSNAKDRTNIASFQRLRKKPFNSLVQSRSIPVRQTVTNQQPHGPIVGELWPELAPLSWVWFILRVSVNIQKAKFDRAPNGPDQTELGFNEFMRDRNCLTLKHHTV